MIDRRSFVVAAGALGGAGLVPRPAAAAGAPVSVLYAGSLVTVFERSLVPAAAAIGLDVHGEPRGSVELAKLISGGLSNPDVFISADPVLIQGLMGQGGFASWYATFAATRMVIGYSPNSPFAHSFVQAARGERKLVDVLLQPGLKIGRTDPALDPKGYRTLIVAQLLQRESGIPDLAEKLLGNARNPSQVFPEETTLVRLESGELDAAFLYSTESAVRRLPAVELPVYANLGNPALDKTYQSVSVTVDGVTRKSGAIVYALTILNKAPDPEGAARFVEFLIAGRGRSLLTAAGVRVLAPAFSGDKAAVPASLRAALGLADAAATK
jgi:molybdate/tungstate transport system substrate-binding protein